MCKRHLNVAASQDEAILNVQSNYSCQINVNEYKEKGLPLKNKTTTK